VRWAVLALKLEEFFKNQAKKNQKSGGLPNSANRIDTREELAKLACVGHDTIYHVWGMILSIELRK
jgi:hypothetical protein